MPVTEKPISSPQKILSSPGWHRAQQPRLPHPDSARIRVYPKKAACHNQPADPSPSQQGCLLCAAARSPPEGTAPSRKWAWDPKPSLSSVRPVGPSRALPLQSLCQKEMPSVIQHSPKAMCWGARSQHPHPQGAPSLICQDQTPRAMFPQGPRAQRSWGNVNR